MKLSISLQPLKRYSYKQVGIYTGVGFLSKAISFGALLFFVNVLSEGDIGILNIFTTTIVFLTPIISLGTLYSISVEYFKLDKLTYAKVLTNSILIPLTLCLLLFPILSVFQGTLYKAFQFQPEFIWLIPLCLFFNFCYESFVILLRNQDKAIFFAVVSIIKIILELGIATALILLLFPTWYGRALGYFFALLVITVVFFIFLWREKFISTEISPSILTKELAFGLSGFILQTAVFSINSSDRFFVMFHFGKEQTAFYSIAGVFATIQYIVCVSMLQYLQPKLFRLFANHKKWKDTKDIYRKYIIVMSLAGVLIFTITVIIYHYLLRPSYLANIHFFYFLCISTFMWTLSNIFLQYVIFIKNKKVIIIISFLIIAFSQTVNIVTASFGSTWLCAAQVINGLAALLIILYFNKKLSFFNEKILQITI